MVSLKEKLGMKNCIRYLIEPESPRERDEVDFDRTNLFRQRKFTEFQCMVRTMCYQSQTLKKILPSRFDCTETIEERKHPL